MTLKILQKLEKDLTYLLQDATLEEVLNFSVSNISKVVSKMVMKLELFTNLKIHVLWQLKFLSQTWRLGFGVHYKILLII